MQDLFELLRGNIYPGRGIVMGRSEDGGHGLVAYFIMGRSENSRNRVFRRTADGIRTEAYVPDKVTDPSLIIYHPVRDYIGLTIVTNGDQTDTIYNSLTSGDSYRRALLSREFEPDAPNYTPRISAIMKPNLSYSMSIIKSADGDPSSCQRFFFEYDSPVAGQGHFISTYKHDGDPLPSFEGEPVNIAVSGEVTEFAELLWDALDEENKISLYVHSIPKSDGKGETIIFNKNLGD